MISGVKIPVLNTLKFHAANVEFDNGVNFNNTDNRSLADQNWQGIYDVCYAHPVPYFWNSGGYGLEFQVYIESFDIFAEIDAMVIDKDNDEVVTLGKYILLVYDSGARQLTFYMNQIYGIDESEIYRVKIERDGTILYYSEPIQFRQYFDHCFPVTYSNFENDFGNIFDGDDLIEVGKYLLPMRMMEPITSDERETFMDDNGGLTTLRSMPRRVYKFETLPIPTWLAEIVQLTFACSDVTVNKLSVNTEELPEAERVTESDLMQVTGELHLKDFTDGFWIDEQKDTATELLYNWIVEDNIVYFENDGKEINAWFTNDDDTVRQYADSNPLSASFGDVLYMIFNVKLYNDGLVLLSDERILLSYDFITIGENMTSDNIILTIDSTDYVLKQGMNAINHIAQSDNPRIRLEPESGYEVIFLEITPSVLKIN